MYYYINSLFFYSFLGFCLESTVYKITHSRRHSGIFYGPIAEVYGFGILALLILKKYVLDKLKWNKYLKLLFTFLTCWVTLTFIEWLGGNILERLFDIHMWDYTKKAYHCGKYICLELSIIWGLFGTFYIYYMKDFFDKVLALIPKKLTIILIILNLIDTFFVFLYKLP